MTKQTWEPLPEKKLNRIRNLFTETYPEKEYGSLAEEIGDYWIMSLRKLWDSKADDIKRRDLAYDPSDPLSRIEQKTLTISYADSVKEDGMPTLETLTAFFEEYFPALGGLHILPACSVSDERFNDGYFSQIDRKQIHSLFGTNELFAAIMNRYFSMNDFVLNHVDIENPIFKSYLEGDDAAGKTFFVFSEDEYLKLKDAGSFDSIFRPRPFPLFTIFRRSPKDPEIKALTVDDRILAARDRIEEQTSLSVPIPLAGILYLFDKILNDQMLLPEDYAYITRFIEHISSAEEFFIRSKTQEVRHFPYIFREDIETPADFLIRCGYAKNEAGDIARSFAAFDSELFGEKIRALTTFSHVQADINLSNFEGLKLLIDDLSFYLRMDLNLLRFDAVNYGFKKWGTSCFGLPEIGNLMNIIYLSMECVSPRIVPNLEVNDSLTAILTQMSDKTSSPPMMHDFHLVSMLPAVFHLERPSILERIAPLVERFDVSKSSIRFSLSESHDGKSVRGSMDLLTLKERQHLAKQIVKQGGKIKFKSTTIGEISTADFARFCRETGLDYDELVSILFEADTDPGGTLVLKPDLRKIEKILSLCPSFAEPEIKDSADYLLTKIVEGREPYELCCTTRNSLEPLGDGEAEARRYLAFHTLAFALMGRNVKTVYVNDLMGLQNDIQKYERTGELRDIKRTKSRLADLRTLLEDNNSFESKVARGINNLIALVDADKALHYRGSEAKVIASEWAEGPNFSKNGEIPAAAVYNSWGDYHSLTVVNVSAKSAALRIPFEGTALAEQIDLYDNLSGNSITVGGDAVLELELQPFDRLWLSAVPIEIDPTLLR